MTPGARVMTQPLKTRSTTKETRNDAGAERWRKTRKEERRGELEGSGGKWNSLHRDKTEVRRQRLSTLHRLHTWVAGTQERQLEVREERLAWAWLGQWEVSEGARRGPPAIYNAFRYCRGFIYLPGKSVCSKADMVLPTWRPAQTGPVLSGESLKLRLFSSKLSICGWEE